ncbi:MAG: VPLPA-CTERM sorting domain-containing protein [Burkholderiales bacterium]|nr:VPLPA-CTERM sorting domain-containing protein [Burkholderiales bacterium]
MNRTLAAAFATACIALAGPAAAATVFSDNFDADTLALNGSLSNWTVSSGTIDVIGTGSFNFYPGNGNFLDLDGTSNNAGRIETKLPLAFTIGQTYTLSFSFGRNGGNAESMTYGVTGGNLSQVFSLLQGGTVPFSAFSIDFVASSASGNIFFDHAGGDNQGIVLDNVRLASVGTAVVPVPAALPLMLTGLIALGAIARRRRA